MAIIVFLGRSEKNSYVNIYKNSFQFHCPIRPLEALYYNVSFLLYQDFEPPRYSSSWKEDFKICHCAHNRDAAAKILTNLLFNYMYIKTFPVNLSFSGRVVLANNLKLFSSTSLYMYDTMCYKNHFKGDIRMCLL
jgi:hypothetical protein